MAPPPPLPAAPPPPVAPPPPPLLAAACPATPPPVDAASLLMPKQPPIPAVVKAGMMAKAKRRPKYVVAQPKSVGGKGSSKGPVVSVALRPPGMPAWQSPDPSIEEKHAHFGRQLLQAFASLDTRLTKLDTLVNSYRQLFGCDPCPAEPGPVDLYAFCVACPWFLTWVINTAQYVGVAPGCSLPVRDPHLPRVSLLPADVLADLPDACAVAPHGDPVAEDGPVAEAPVHGDDSAVPDAIDPMVGAVDDYTTGRDRLESRVHTLG